ncbi:MAG: hypothetical protein HY553_13305, partial [Elusimicrobia bacterium]|nr:hypothetical protein [Elusimicrobiota bacterium]
VQYGALCGVYSDCNPDWSFDDCAACCNPAKWNWTTCSQEDPYGMGEVNYGSHGWGTCQ